MSYDNIDPLAHDWKQVPENHGGRLKLVCGDIGLGHDDCLRILDAHGYRNPVYENKHQWNSHVERRVVVFGTMGATGGRWDAQKILNAIFKEFYVQALSGANMSQLRFHLHNSYRAPPLKAPGDDKTQLSGD